MPIDNMHLNIKPKQSENLLFEISYSTDLH